MATLPTGTVTFLFTDIESSARMWEDDSDTMRVSLSNYDAIVTKAVASRGGLLVRPRGEGDSFFAVFPLASEAVLAAAAIQRTLEVNPSPAAQPLKVRIALHTGEADLRDGDYYGPEVNRCARLRSLAQGGQTLLSQSTAELTRRSLPQPLELRPLGRQRLKDLKGRENVYELIRTQPRIELKTRQVKAGRKRVFAARWATRGALVLATMILVFVGVYFGQLQRQASPADTAPLVLSKPPSSPPPGQESRRSPYARLDRQEDAVIHPSGIRFSITAHSQTLHPSQALNLRVVMANPAAEKRRVVFPVGQLFDVWVVGLLGPDAGKEVYRWSEERSQVFSGKERTVDWRPGEERSFPVVWVPPVLAVRVKYRIAAVMMAEVPVEASLDLASP